ncbi:hypothetical protein ACHAWC_007709 [Mediolabrus comicus]
MNLSRLCNAFLFMQSSSSLQQYVFEGGYHRNFQRHQASSVVAALLAAHNIHDFKPDQIYNSDTTKLFPSSTDDRGTLHYKLTILIPAYNEAERIGETLCTYINYMKCQPVMNYSSQLQLLQTDNNMTNDASSIERKNTGECSILVVDDGSTDSTAQYVHDKEWLVVLDDDEVYQSEKKDEKNYWKVSEHVKCISLSSNQGKGAAVAYGMSTLHQQQQRQQQRTTEKDTSDENTTVRSIVLVADADGSGDISCIHDMIHSLECLLSSSSLSKTTSDLGIIVGKRQYPLHSKSKIRSILNWGFRTCVSILFWDVDGGSSSPTATSSSSCSTTTTSTSSSPRRKHGLGVTDTQCGFKLMTSTTGRLLYTNLNLQKWSHDVEVIYRAHKLGIPIDECDVQWVHKDGSKILTSRLDVVVMSGVMLSEIIWMRLLYALGIWK